MANTQSISINTEAAYSVMTYVANSCAILESDVSGKMSSGFEALTSLGFLSSLSTIENQVSTLMKAHQSIVSEITSHMTKAQDTEDDLKNNYKNGTFSGGYSSSGGYSTGGTTGGEAVSEAEALQVEEEDDGKKISADQLRDMLLNIDGEYQKNLIELINANKDDDTSLVDLLMDNKNSKELYKVLKKIFGDKLDISDMKLEDYEKVRKTLIDMIVKSDVEIPSLSENTLLVGKEYLAKVSKDNNIDPSTLLFDDTYKVTLQIALVKMYVGEVDNTMSEEAINNFKAYMDSLAEKNNMTVAELIEKHVDLIK